MTISLMQTISIWVSTMRNAIPFGVSTVKSNNVLARRSHWLIESTMYLLSTMKGLFGSSLVTDLDSNLGMGMEESNVTCSR